MLKIETYLKSAPGSPYSSSAPVDADRAEGENPADYEKRIWKQRAHYNTDREAVIPGNMFKRMLDRAAERMSLPVSGIGYRTLTGHETMTKHFAYGVMAMDHLPLGIKEDDIQGEWLFAGRRVGGKRIWKRFPLFEAWEGWVTWHIVDPAVTQEIF